MVKVEFTTFPLNFYGKLGEREKVIEDYYHENTESITAHKFFDANCTKPWRVTRKID